jgi:hypothetical protein
MGPAAVVPVSLLEFNGHYQNKTIVLNWTTEADLNAKHFTIEKSSDAHIFRALTTIPALAGSQSKKNYHYIDSAHNGINYYRLKMVGFDGNYSYSKIIAVTTPTQHFTIYPNPVKDKLYISVPNSSMASMISIVDMKGTTIKSLPMIEGEFYTILRTDNLSSGVYYIIFTSGFLRESLKFIKQ